MYGLKSSFTSFFDSNDVCLRKIDFPYIASLVSSSSYCSTSVTCMAPPFPTSPLKSSIEFAIPMTEIE